MDDDRQMSENQYLDEVYGDEDCKHPEITVELVGTDGNAFAILGAVRKAMKRAGVEQAELDAFTTEATSGDYDQLLQTCMKWVNIE